MALCPKSDRPAAGDFVSYLPFLFSSWSAAACYPEVLESCVCIAPSGGVSVLLIGRAGLSRGADSGSTSRQKGKVHFQNKNATSGHVVCFQMRAHGVTTGNADR